jgi:hypothetical protein
LTVSFDYESYDEPILRHITYPRQKSTVLQLSSFVAEFLENAGICTCKYFTGTDQSNESAYCYMQQDVTQSGSCLL